MVMRINVDCNACCRKLRRIILNMKGEFLFDEIQVTMYKLQVLITSLPFHIEEIESHLIEKQQRSVYVSGIFRPSDVAIKIRKKMNRRVEILEIQELNATTEEGDPNQQAGG
jgi:predicted DCC family thiol-disulfide oxidoreductase YuxK